MTNPFPEIEREIMRRPVDPIRVWIWGGMAFAVVAVWVGIFFIARAIAQ